MSEEGTSHSSSVDNQLQQIELHATRVGLTTSEVARVSAYFAERTDLIKTALRLSADDDKFKTFVLCLINGINHSKPAIFSHK